MLFSGLDFIFRFLPVFLIVYRLVPARARKGVLFVGSLVFYALGEPVYVLLLLAELMIGYALYRISSHTRKKWITGLAIVLEVAVLAFFKFGAFLSGEVLRLGGGAGWIFPEGMADALAKGQEIALPLGISFYTFQLIAFLSDEGMREPSPGERPVSFGSFAAYITMFPQLVAGPIVQYREVREDMEAPAMTLRGLEEGGKIFAAGLAYKVLLANPVGTLFRSVLTAGVRGLGAENAWLGAIAYTFQIYFDFYGYSLMAIGLGKMLGFSLPENFREPYSARSFTQFWRRWHITLGRWFREYVYIPLGGSRAGKARTIRNLLIVWALTGIWHGAGWNFLLWGLLFFVFLVLEKNVYGRFLEKHAVAGHLYVLLLLPVTWVIFGISDPGTLAGYLRSMVGLTQGPVLTGSEVFMRHLHTYGALLAACLVCATPLPAQLWARYRKKVWMSLLLFAAFLFACYELAIGSSNPFLYFRF